MVLATGAHGIIFGRSTNSVICTGTAASAVYQQGAVYGNGEFIQVHPTAIPGADKLRLISESARGEGGRVWVPKDKVDKALPPRHPREGSRLLPGADVPRLRQPRLPRHRLARPLQDLLPRGARHLQRRHRPERERGLPRPHPQGREVPPQQARRHPGDLREVRRRRPLQEPDEGLPRRPLLDGRPLGRLRARRPGLAQDGLAPEPLHQHPRALRRRRGRLPVPRRQPPRRQLTPVLHLGGMATGPAVATYQERLGRSAFDLPKSIFEKAEKKARDDYETPSSSTSGSSTPRWAWALPWSRARRRPTRCACPARAAPRWWWVADKRRASDRRPHRASKRPPCPRRAPSPPRSRPAALDALARLADRLEESSLKLFGKSAAIDVEFKPWSAALEARRGRGPAGDLAPPGAPAHRRRLPRVGATWS